MTGMIEHVLHAAKLNAMYAQANLADIPDEKFAAFAGKLSPPAFLVGHVAASLEGGIATLGGESQLPDGWDELFGFGVAPSDDPSAYPPKAELMDALDSAYHRVIERLRTTSEEMLAAPTPHEPIREIFPTIGDMVVSLITMHPAIHWGQLSAWRVANDLPLPI